MKTHSLMLSWNLLNQNASVQRNDPQVLQY